jgi:glycosyltransferase involved in cell wall biosynthesis
MNTQGLRIAIVSNTAWNLFNFRLNLIHKLQAAGHTVTAVAPTDKYADKLKSAGVAFESVPISASGVNPLAELLSVWRLRAAFKRQRVDLVLSYTPKGNLYSALACMALGLPFVPNVSGLGRAFIRRSPVTWLALALYRLTFRRAHHVFFQNLDDMGAFLRANLVRTDQAERLPGSGVDLVRFTAKPMDAEAGEAPTFLLVARMLWDKGIGEYIAAARLVKAGFPAATFRLLGGLVSDNPSAISKQQVDAWVKEGVVTYLGSTDDVRPYLADADCVVLPSYREGVPRVLLEAAAMARPLIATDAPGCRDAVLDGKTGFICRPRNAEDLADKMHAFVALTGEQRHTMGHTGRAFVEQHFDEQVVLDRYHHLVAAFATAKQTPSLVGTFAPPRPGARGA